MSSKAGMRFDEGRTRQFSPGKIVGGLVREYLREQLLSFLEVEFPAE